MRDKSYGQLYLGNKKGSREFSQDDEDAILALATAAGIAIQNARLFERERRRQQWLEAASELTHLLLREVKRDVALRTVTQRLREVSGADYGGMLLVNPTHPEVVDLEAVEGPGIGQTSGSSAPLQGLTARVIKTGRGVVSEDLLHIEGANPPPDWREAVSTMGLGMLLPLIAPGEILGVLFAGWRRGSPDEQLAASEVSLVEMFASQAALALQQVRAQQNRSRLLVLEDRDRIAHDLHDAVIQRLFAIGTRLHSAAGLTSRPEVRRRVTAAIEELDHTTEDVRSAIFQLHDKGGEGPPIVRERLMSEVDGARRLFGFTPRFVLHGTMEGIPPPLHPDLLAAVPDALALIARHVSASSVEVILRVDPDMVSLLVTAIGPRSTPTGLDVDTGIGADLAERARRLGGSCTTRTIGLGANAISWQVPIRSL
jgi:signal transduction histidine kinase